VLLIVIAIPMLMYRRETLPELHFRPAGIQLLAPQGLIEYREIAFAWTSSVVAAQYRVDIGNAAGVLETHYSETSQILRITMKPGANYWWSVTALDGRGRPVAKSQRLTFTVR